MMFMHFLSRFDSNYHFVVPEFSDETDFQLNFNKALEEYNEAKALGVATRPVAFLALSLSSLLARPLQQIRKCLSEVSPRAEKIQINRENRKIQKNGMRTL